MKKIIALLCLLTLIGLVGCSKKDKENIFEQVVIPVEEIGLERISTGFNGDGNNFKLFTSTSNKFSISNYNDSIDFYLYNLPANQSSKIKLNAYSMMFVSFRIYREYCDGLVLYYSVNGNVIESYDDYVSQNINLTLYSGDTLEIIALNNSDSSIHSYINISDFDINL